ncbi:MAG TPA: hypothetical protein IAB12_06330 [Candidatus Ornithospirochaeta avicola]|uniref:Uncharacterized protein n=1 Tax=Candidatus Ornithospirochaeta avicola TaxID=2840896 RepID=A0A9D1TNI6_9SPIO|nr:hypothetical protein [Candidatus Ornithospirochaeta avicola]
MKKKFLLLLFSLLSLSLIIISFILFSRDRVAFVLPDLPDEMIFRMAVPEGGISYSVEIVRESDFDSRKEYDLIINHSDLAIENENVISYSFDYVASYSPLISKLENMSTVLLYDEENEMEKELCTFLESNLPLFKAISYKGAVNERNAGDFSSLIDEGDVVIASSIYDCYALVESIGNSLVLDYLDACVFQENERIIFTACPDWNALISSALSL